MANTPYTLDAFMPSGDVLIKKAGETNWREVGNCSDISTQDKTTKKELKSSMRDSAGQVIASKTRLDGCDFKMTINQFNMLNFEMALAGVSSLVTQTAVTDGSAALTAELNTWQEIGKLKLSGVVVTVSSTEKTEGTDYELKSDFGLVKFLSTGSIAEGAAVSVTYDAAAITSGGAYQTDGGVNAETECAVMVDGIDEITGDPVRLDIWSVKLSPSGSVKYITEDFNSVDLSGSAEKPSDKSSPYRITRIIT